MNLPKEIVEEINDHELYLRKINSDDIEFLYNSLGEENIIKYMSLGPLYSLKQAKNLLNKYLDYWENNKQFNYIIELREGQAKNKIGVISIWNISWLHERSEIGIWMIPSHWNKGYGTRALEMIKTISFVYIELNRLEAHIVDQNQSSNKLFSKSGFKKEGILKEYINLRGKYYNAILYACLKKDF
ncbi:MAG: GNAT family N-acetyltransferase [Candidatus Lokiarchaeota archaeon]|nr:GNAT family N-acetyltransferase [Candidatus Lokiarchaeota archaeon]MBD3200471.1 GNAT family N-acetyltransferase [Candidatus Lokiarchaeota archaeon]